MKFRVFIFVCILSLLSTGCAIFSPVPRDYVIEGVFNQTTGRSLGPAYNAYVRFVGNPSHFVIVNKGKNAENYLIKVDMKKDVDLAGLPRDKVIYFNADVTWVCVGSLEDAVRTESVSHVYHHRPDDLRTEKRLVGIHKRGKYYNFYFPVNDKLYVFNNPYFYKN